MKELDEFSGGLNKTLQETHEALQATQSLLIEYDSKLKESIEVIAWFEVQKLE